MCLLKAFAPPFHVHMQPISETLCGFSGRWTFSAKVKAIPWQQKLIFTGRSYYAISGAGQLQSQRDVWDAVLDNDFLSVCPLLSFYGCVSHVRLLR
jgi:hypothetical protein